MIDSYGKTQADRLRKARLDMGIKKAADAIKRFGWAESTYNSHENGNRTFPLERAKVYAKAYKVNPYWLLDGTVNDLVTFGNVESTDHVKIKVIGFVQAGQFGGADELYSEEGEMMYVSPKFKNAHCLIVRGDSMNERYKEGTKLICIPFFGTPEEVKPGAAVIVEAISTADEKEITVKEFYTDDNGTHWLLPRSTNPIYQNYPVPNGQDLNIIINGRTIKEINITALVVSSQYDEDWIQ